jgi:hypothetical protein
MSTVTSPDGMPYDAAICDGYQVGCLHLVSTPGTHRDHNAALFVRHGLARGWLLMPRARGGMTRCTGDLKCLLSRESLRV